MCLPAITSAQAALMGQAGCERVWGSTCAAMARSAGTSIYLRAAAEVQDVLYTVTDSMLACEWSQALAQITPTPIIPMRPLIH